QMMEPIPEIISGRLGPKKFDENHCNPANEPPATNTAGNTSPSLLNPAIKITRYSGTKKDKMGNVLPTICEIAISGMPETCDDTNIGVPMAPNATGAVLA